MHATDPLEWLLPQAKRDERERARRVATFLRLLMDDARGPRAGQVGSDVRHVVDEFERLSRERIANASVELLCHELGEARPGTSFLPLPRPRHSFLRAHQELEVELQHVGRELCWPLEDTLAPASRGRRIACLLQLVEQHGRDPRDVAFLRLAWRHLNEGPAAVERAWRTCVASSRSEADPESLGPLARQGLVAALLERGRPGLAWRRLCRPQRNGEAGEGGPLLVFGRELEPSPTSLRAWTGFAAGIHGWPAEEPIDGVPAALAQALCRVGLPARSRPATPSHADEPDLHHVAAASGALVAAAFAWSGTAIQAVAWSVAPRWRAAFGAFSLHVACDPDPGRWGLWSVLRGSSESACAPQGGPVAQEGPSRHGARSSAPPGGLFETLPETAKGAAGRHAEGQLRETQAGRSGASTGDAVCSTTVTLLREPLRDSRGAVCGWLQLEYDHRLTPTKVACERLARRLGPSVAEAAIRLRAGGGPRRRAALALLHALPREVLASRWEVHDVEECCPVAYGGGDLGSTERGVGKAQARAVREGRQEVWAEDPRQACHAGAGGGFVVPLRYAGRVHGTLVLERAGSASRPSRESPGKSPGKSLTKTGSRSTRILEDPAFKVVGLRRQVLEKVVKQVEQCAPQWRAAQFERWHATTFGRTVALRLDPVGWRSKLTACAVRARRREPLAVVGPVGSARIVQARWLHFEGPGPEAPCMSLRLSARQRRREARVLSERWTLVSREGGTLVVHASHVDPELVASVRRERREGQGGLLVLLAESTAGVERLDLPEHAVLRLPPLHERPEEALDWAERWLGSERWTPAARAWIRRQRFPRQLETLAATLREVRRRTPSGPISAKLLDACLSVALKTAGS